MIVLIGMPGCGKSTIGRLLARRLNVPFFDSDQVIEQRLGETIRSYFDREGESAFRDVEEAVLRDVLQPAASDAVVATGGGAVLRPANRQQMRVAAQVIYLRATPEDIFRRVRYDTKRHLLQVDNPLAKLQELYRVRDPLYRETAHFVVETARASTAAVVNLITMQLEQARLTQPAAAGSAP